MSLANNYYSPEKSKDSDSYSQGKDLESKLQEVKIVIIRRRERNNIIYGSLNYTG